MTMSGSSTAKKTEITTINIRVVLLASRCLLFSLRGMRFTTIRMAEMMIDDNGGGVGDHNVMFLVTTHLPPVRGFAAWSALLAIKR